jgi:dimethylhistidine N-methyltransferase
MIETTVLTPFAKEIEKGLSSNPKVLSSKYFYDEEGDKLFQTIMGLGEYYLTRAEFQIFDEQKEAILKSFLGSDKSFSLIELGAGDGTKTKVLLQHFIAQEINFNYFPIDISNNVLKVLSNDLSKSLPELKVNPIQGDYFEALAKLNQKHNHKEIVLFLGSNIGNFSTSDTELFLTKLASNLRTGDMLLIGFDLMKDPNVILNAYNDQLGVTKAFNLNLLKRINKELGANFDINAFNHFPTYNPITGETKSHLISTKNQKVVIEALDKTVYFNEWEAIHTEVSQKYSMQMIEDFASQCGFKIINNFTDRDKYFIDSLWEKL